MKHKKLFLAPLIFATCACAQSAQKVAASVVDRWNSTRPFPAGFSMQALLLDGMTAEWQATANSTFAAIKAQVDPYVAADGSIPGYNPQTATLDDLQLGRALVFLYRTTQEKKYALAAQLLHQQLATHPRLANGLYAHSQSDPHKVWLSDANAIEPFRAAYAATFQQPQEFDSIASQLLLFEAQLRDPKSGLLHIGWDGSRSARWADKATGLDPAIFSPTVGEYAVALVDVLNWLPRDHPQRPALIATLNRTMTAILKVQDSDTSLWWVVMDHALHHTPQLKRQPDGSLRLSLSRANDGNLLDPAASCLFAYVLARGARLGYFPQSDAAIARRIWKSILNDSASANPDGTLNLRGIAAAFGPHADFNTADHQPLVDQASAVGAFLLAGSELDQPTAGSNSPAQSTVSARTGLLPSSKDFHAPTSAPPQQASTRRITAMVDAWFNSQTRKNALGQTELFHYKWDDDSINGYSLFGRAFQHHSGDLAMLPEAPTRANLAPAQVYVIASPDIPIKNPNPHYMDEASGDAIEAWVRSGGVLLLFMNDRDNTEFTHFNTLSDRFGIHFNPVLSHHVLEPEHSGGEVVIPANTGIFRTGFTAYMKDTSTITPTGPAHAVVTDHGDVMIAVSHLGKGTVLAIVDPWIYNEYADGRKMRQYRGFEAADDIAAWAVRQAQSVKAGKP